MQTKPLNYAPLPFFFAKSLHRKANAINISIFHFFYWIHIILETDETLEVWSSFYIAFSYVVLFKMMIKVTLISIG